MTASLLPIVNKFKDSDILVVGDLILDHYIWGNVDRISPEAPVVVVETTKEDTRLGGAGNVVNNLVTLESKVSVCGVVGDDENGKNLVAQLESLGVNVEHVLVDKQRPTTVKTRVIAHGQQVVRVDREDKSPLSGVLQKGINEAVKKSFNTTNGIIVSDYAKGAISEEMFSEIDIAYEAGKVGFGKIPVLVDPKMPNFSLYRHATVVKPNKKEAEEATGKLIRSRADAVRAGFELIDWWNSDIVLITLGEMGMVLVSKLDGVEHTAEIETVAQEVYDVSGAGDTVSAVFTLALASGATLEEAANLSNYAAGLVVAEIGTAAVSADELRQIIGKA